MVANLVLYAGIIYTLCSCVDVNVPSYGLGLADGVRGVCSAGNDYTCLIARRKRVATSGASLSTPIGYDHGASQPGSAPGGHRRGGSRGYRLCGRNVQRALTYCEARAAFPPARALWMVGAGDRPWLPEELLATELQDQPSAL